MGSVENNIEMGILGFPNECYDYFGFPNSSPAPPPSPIFAQIGKKKKVRNVKPKAGSTIRVSATKDSDGFVSQQLSACNNESQLI